jgi:hypothetical protein
MKRWLHMATSLLLLTMLTVSTATPARAEIVPDKPVVSQEVKAELIELRGQLHSIKQKEHTIRQFNHRMKTDSRKLRQLVRKADDKQLKEQVYIELKSFHDNLRAAYQLHKQGEELKKKIQSARINRDLKQLRTLTGQLDELKTRQLEHLRAANQDLLKEVERVKDRVR